MKETVENRYWSSLHYAKNYAVLCLEMAIASLVLMEIMFWIMKDQTMGYVNAVVTLCWCSAAFALGCVISKTEKPLYVSKHYVTNLEDERDDYV